MKVKAKIFQIVPWEKKENYFHRTDYGNRQVDLLHLAAIKDEREKWYHTNTFGFLNSVLERLFKIKTSKVFPYNNFIFHSRCTEKGNEFYFQGLPVLVDSPCGYSVGDIIELEINVKK